jgi:hypothetical protein
MLKVIINTIYNIKTDFPILSARNPKGPQSIIGTRKTTDNIIEWGVKIEYTNI